jgi:uroporphyrinogen-III synthase
MQKTNKHILSTRPLAKTIIAEAAMHDIIIEELSFIETRAILNAELSEKIKELSTQKLIVVFTSMNAVEAVAAEINSEVDWCVYSMGNTTKKLVEEKLKPRKIIAAAENAEELARHIIDDDIKEVIFFCGNIRRDELPNKLKSQKVKVEEVVVYETIEIENVVSKAYDGILFFSPSAVKSFFKNNKVAQQTQLFAIGKTTAETLRQFANKKIIVANTTDKIELARQAIAYFSK